MKSHGRGALSALELVQLEVVAPVILPTLRALSVLLDPSKWSYYMVSRKDKP